MAAVEWLSLTQTAALCGVHVMTVGRWRKDPATQFPAPDGSGGGKRYRRDVVEAWLKVHRPWTLLSP